MKLLLLLLAFVSAEIKPERFELKKVRDVYERAAFDEQAAIKFLSDADQVKNDNMLNGYKGAVKMIMAKYQMLPWNKYLTFREGKALLDEAIGNDKSNTELIYLRFSIQTNVPGFLNYHHQIQHDKNYLIKAMSSLKDADLKIRITRYLMQSSILSILEKQQLKQSN